MFKNAPTTIASLVLTALSFRNEPSSAEESVDYLDQIRPIFEAHCTECHDQTSPKARLRLDTPEGILRGGDSGEPVFVPGKSAASLLIKLVTSEDPDEVMPAEGQHLSTQQVDLLRAWIDQGATMPGNDGVKNTALETDHWSFQPIVTTAVPPSENPFIRNEIDSFILNRLTAEGLAPSEASKPAELVRRLFLVTTGLPPSPETVNEFLEASEPDAYESLVDHVLNSPHYGERWARHWLDVVRYADSNGFETNRERKNAYHYRDYVIRAFNEDIPYDQFIREQIAGDALEADAATGFLVAGAHDIVKSPDISLTLMQRQNELDDMVNTTGTAFLGLTLGCARCHNHKFDPVLQKDYYSFQAVFAGVHHGERALRKQPDDADLDELERLKERLAADKRLLAGFQRLSESRAITTSAEPLRPPVNARQNVEDFPAVPAKALRFSILASSSAEPCIDELEVYDALGTNVALSDRGAVTSTSGTLPGYDIHREEHLNDGQVGNDHSWISNTPGTGWVQIEFPATVSITRVVWGRDRTGMFHDRVPTLYSIDASTDLQSWTKVASSEDRRTFLAKPDPDDFLRKLTGDEITEVSRLRESIRKIQLQIDRLTDGEKAWAGTFSQPETTHRLYRGDPFAKREAVPPDALTVLGSLGMALDEPEQHRRLKLADWIASPDNPLTARVMVNRIWHYIFGRGIVETPSDLGANGAPPTHPALLDWLADEFVKSGWSIKHIQRLILTSNTFRQSSRPTPRGMAKDFDVRLLWRFPPRRLEAEAIRDSILSVSEQLDTRMGGPGFYLHDVQEENVMHYFPKEKFGPTEFRRMVYLFKIRQEQDAIFGSFDCPDGNQVMPIRSRSNTPLQALNLFNSAFVLQQAEAFAERLEKEVGIEPQDQARRAFLLAFSRNPDAFELNHSVDLIELEGLEALCRALFNTSEFIFIF